jgi:hypothetical protein
MPPRERRGRPVTRKRRRADPVERAVTYGLDVSLLYAGRRISVAERLQRLDDNSVFLAEARRGKEKGT